MLEEGFEITDFISKQIYTRKQKIISHRDNSLWVFGKQHEGQHDKTVGDMIEEENVGEMRQEGSLKPNQDSQKYLGLSEYLLVFTSQCTYQLI